jgi:acyl-CoA hydrolase
MSSQFAAMTAEEAAAYINHGDTVAFSGFTPAGAAKAVLSALGEHPDIPPFFMFSKVFQNSMVDLVATGKLQGASATSLTITADKLQQIVDNMDVYGHRIVLRPQEISKTTSIRCRSS